jgi:hypothetical protein
MEELKEALKIQEMENHLVKITQNSELYRYAGHSFHETQLIFLITFIRWEKCQWNGKTVLSYLHNIMVTNKRLKTIEQLACLMHVVNHIVQF